MVVDNAAYNIAITKAIATSGYRTNRIRLRRRSWAFHNTLICHNWGPFVSQYVTSVATNGCIFISKCRCCRHGSPWRMQKVQYPSFRKPRTRYYISGLALTLDIMAVEVELLRTNITPAIIMTGTKMRSVCSNGCVANFDALILGQK